MPTHSQTSPSEGFITIRQATTLAGKSKQWIYTQVRQQRLTLYKLGNGRSRLKEVELTKLLLSFEEIVPVKQPKLRRANGR